VNHFLKTLFVFIFSLTASGAFATSNPSPSLTNPILINPTVTNMNGSTLTYGLLYNSNPTPANGGTGYNVGDTLTLNDNCSTHAVLSVVTTSSTPGPITAYNITNQGFCSALPANPVTVLATSGSGSGATFTLSWGLLVAGMQFGNLTLGNNGNTFLGGGSQSPNSLLAGKENTFFGTASGGNEIGISTFNAAFGLDSCGVGGSPGVFNSTSCFGTDAGRDLSGGTGITAIGTGALYSETHPSSQISALVAVGDSAMRYLDSGAAPNNSSALGSSACIGASSGASFYQGTCVGGSTGGAVTSGNRFTIIGAKNGNSVFATGNTVLLIGSGGVTVDTPAANTSNYVNIENVITITGTGTPSTSTTTIAGNLAVGGAITGLNSNLFYGISPLSTATPATGGTGNAQGDVLTLADGCSTHATLSVSSVSSGAVTGFVITNPGICQNPPSNPVSVTSSTGSGSGATFTLSWAPIASSVITGSLTQNSANLFIGNGTPYSAFTGSETILIGTNAGANATGASSFDTVIGPYACGGASGTPGVLNNSVCIGGNAGKSMGGGSGITVIGSGAFYTASQAASQTAAYVAVGDSSMYYENSNVTPNNSVALGSSSCKGAASGASFRQLTCLGASTGAALSTAFTSTIIGYNVGNTTFASGSGVILIGSGAETVDTPSANTSNYINLEGILTVTGTNTPSTSAANFAGSLTVNSTLNANSTTNLSLSTTSGFIQLPYQNGVPTGAPSGNTNCAIDISNGYLNCYYGSAWHKIAFSAGAG